MITVEKKLNIFSKLILEREQKELSEKHQEIKESNDRIIKDRREKAEAKARQLIESKVNKANVEKNAIISKATNEAKIKVLNKKKELLKRAIEGVKNKAKQFIDTEEYENYLLNLVTEVLSELKDEKEIILYVLPTDAERFKKKLKDTIKKSGASTDDVQIEPSSNDIIGGVIAVNKAQSIRIDASISSTIEDNRDIIGHMLYEELTKAGDINE